jgi:hypothetical protein
MENRSITKRLLSLTAITLLMNGSTGAISPAFAKAAAVASSVPAAKDAPAKSNAIHFKSVPIRPTIPKAESISRAQVTNTAVEAWRKDAPKMSAPRPFNLPAITSYTLENGLEVQMVEDHRYPFISATIGFRDGTSNEPKEMLGLADMTADLLTEGTITRTSKEIASEIDFIGGGLAASTDYDYTILSGSALSPYTERLFDVLC